MSNNIRIAIDAGHGSDTAGKRTPDGYREHWANVAVASKLYQLLQNDGYTLLKTGWNDNNSKDDVNTPLATRQKQIKDFKANASISIHFNAYGDGKTYNDAQGVETLISDKYANDSYKLATLIQNELIKGTQQRNRGVKKQALAMCNCNAMGTKASILVELAFMTNKREADLMDDENFIWECAKELRNGINNYFGINNNVNSSNNNNSNDTNKINKNNYTNEEFINFVGKIAVEDYKTHPILPSITIGQAIKESNWGKSELAQNANALFGIKKNGWQGETYIKQATEQKLNGEYYTVNNVEWRKYKDWEESIKDHGEYLCTRKVGNQQHPNWYKMIGEKDLDKAIYYLQNATYKYATSQTYETSLKNDYIIKYNLTKFDDMVLNNEEIQEKVEKVEFKLYLIVKNCNSFLRIRKEPHTGATITGYLKNNVTRYTIVEEKDGWGRLKSGIGWIHLDYVKKVDK